MVISTSRLMLREFLKSDWRRVLEYQSTPEHAKFNSWYQRSEKDVKTFIGRFIQWQNDYPRGRFQLAIILKSEELLIGNCGIRTTLPSLETELGFELDPNYWHRGYATEASNGLLEFAFERLQIQSVRAHCVADNEASGRVLRRLGMHLDKRESNALWMKERWWDIDHYSLNVEEWARRERCQSGAESLRL